MGLSEGKIYNTTCTPFFKVGLSIKAKWHNRLVTFALNSIISIVFLSENNDLTKVTKLNLFIFA